MLDFSEIDKKWQRLWAEARIFESDPDTSKKAYMVTAAFPYVNAPQHIGHLRSYGTADVLARYKRMRGYNVLYPMAFHATGTPILAFAKRIKNGDKTLRNELKLFHVPDEEINKMTDPLYIAGYFAHEIEDGMHLAGYSIDWRRKFISIDKFFSKFVEWQFGILNSKGFITRGRHPVGWCPNENNAVGMHDTKHDVEPEIEEEVAIKFEVEGEPGRFLLCTTFRPETIYGVTNVFVGEEITYALCAIGGMEGLYYISSAAVQILGYQFVIEQKGEISGLEMLSKKCKNPATGEVVPVLPGYFLKEKVGTGIVMSVPAHAPFDLDALAQLKSKGYPKQPLAIKKVIEINSDSNKRASMAGEHNLPSEYYISISETEGKSREDVLKEATKLEYKDESHFGKMLLGEEAGMPEPKARELLKKKLIENAAAIKVYSMANSPIFCRCGSEIVVKVVDNQWFLNYGNSEWKTLAQEAFGLVKILPAKSRKAFESAIRWIDLRAVVRAQGLGTRFPYDNEYIIESLSDSTIYMSFYTISHLIRDLGEEHLTKEFFDYVFLGKGDADSVSKSSGISYELLKKCRDSFVYWYKDTSRHSGPDLIFNHLTMYIFNHSAIFEREYWPKQIVVNGSVLMEGEKMSKSLGNIVPLADGIRKYGADPIRFVVVCGADLFSDSEFSDYAVNGVKERIAYIYDACKSVDTFDSGKLTDIDYWLYSKLSMKISRVTECMEALELRSASTLVLYDSVIELKRYLARGGKNSLVVKEFLDNVVLLLSPIMPHVAEELWETLGNPKFACTQSWPIADSGAINNGLEQLEEIMDSTLADCKQVISLVNKKSGNMPAKITLITPADWKVQLWNSVAENKNIAMVKASLNEDKSIDENKKAAEIEYISHIGKKIGSLNKLWFDAEHEFLALSAAAGYISSAIGCKVVVEKEETSESARATRSMPDKPSIDAS